jgi:uncharacterized protein (TIGR03067 family)
MFRNVMQVARTARPTVRSLQIHAPAPRDGDAVRMEVAKFQGGWVLVYWLYNGKERPTHEQKIALSFVGETFVIHEGDTEIEKGAFTDLDPDQDPKAFTYAPSEVRGGHSS